jgi:hypothetical protein
MKRKYQQSHHLDTACKVQGLLTLRTVGMDEQLVLAQLLVKCTEYICQPADP